MHGLVWFLCPSVEHSWGFDSSIYSWFMDFCGGIGWGSKLRRFILDYVLVFRNRPDWYAFFERYADFCRNRYNRSISVSRFAFNFRPEPDFGRPKSIGLPITALIGSTGGFGSTEPGIFGTTGVNFSMPFLVWNLDSVPRRVNRLIWFSRTRDFRSIGGIFGVPFQG